MPDAVAAQPSIRSAHSVFDVVRAMARDIKLAHSIFALPFAVLGAVLAWNTHEPTFRTWMKLTLVVVCMVCARTWAMVVNRIADRQIDSENPRTIRRAIASGRVRTRDGVLVAAGAAFAFIASCSMFVVVDSNAWPVLLSVPVLGWIAFYSFTKRFTMLCHLFLGGALAASPVAAAIAMQPGSLAATPSIWFLAAMVLCWVAGFDIIYALQDLAFDRDRGLHSIPASMGPAGAVWFSRVLHAAAFALLVLAWRTDERLGMIFFAGVCVTGVLLVAEHIVLARQGERGLAMAFFTLNGIVSCVLGTAGIVDVLI